MVQLIHIWFNWLSSYLGNIWNIIQFVPLTSKYVWLLIDTKVKKTKGAMKNGHSWDKGNMIVYSSSSSNLYLKSGLSRACRNIQLIHIWFNWLSSYLGNIWNIIQFVPLTSKYVWLLIDTKVKLCKKQRKELS
jgi:hypothetical protein